MTKTKQLYEGKAKKVWATDDENIVIVDYKDDATAFNGIKKGTIAGKGVVNNKMSNYLMQLLEKHGVPTHFVKELSDRETAVKKVTIVPLEVIIRNRAAGSICKRLGLEEGMDFVCPSIEFSYKDDELGDPLINGYHAVSCGFATREEVERIKELAFKVNDVLKEYFASIGVELIDFKLEFGKTADGTIVLADEISPDTCRFWDIKTHEKLDKDRFRRDLGGVEEAYEEMMKRCILKDFDLFGCDFAEDSDSESRTRERLTPYKFFRNTELFADLADLVLKQIAERLDCVDEINIIGLFPFSTTLSDRAIEAILMVVL